MLGLIMSFFGYVKTSPASTKLAYEIKMEALSEKPNLEKIARGAQALEDLYRSENILGYLNNRK